MVKPNAYDFFLAYLGVPVILASWIGYKIWKEIGHYLSEQRYFDLDTGRINVDLDLLQQEIAEEKAQLAEKPFYIRIYRFWC